MAPVFLRLRSLRVVVSLLSVALSNLIFIADAQASYGSTNSNSMSLTASPSFIQPSKMESISFSMAGNYNPSTLLAAILVYPKITSRSDLSSILNGGPLSYPQAITPSVTLSTLHLGSSDTYRFPFMITTSASTGNTSAQSVEIPCTYNCDGVYPVVVRIESSTTFVPVAQLDTPLALLTSQPSQPLALSLIADLGHNSPKAAVIERLVGVLSRYPQLQPSLVLSGPSMTQISRMTTAKTSFSLTKLQQWSSTAETHELITSTYVPVLANCLLRSEAAISFSSQVNTMVQVSKGLFRSPSQPSGVLELARGITPAVLREATSMGYHNFVLPGSALSDLNLNLSLTQPVDIRGVMGASALALDSTLTRDLATGSAPTSSARAIAEAAQIYFEQPNDIRPRVVSAQINITDQASVARLQSVLQALSTTSFVQTVTASQAFSNSAKAASQPPLGSLPQFSSKGCASLNPAIFSQALKEVTTFDSTSPTAPLTSTFKNSLLAAESFNLDSRERKVHLAQLALNIRQQLSQILLTGGNRLTVTSRKTTLPLSFISKAPYAVNFQVKLASDKLSFSSGQIRRLKLNHQTGTVAFSVSVKALGSFPVKVLLLAPNGQLISESEIAISSAAFSPVGVVLSGGSITILIYWWFRTYLRSRNGKNKPDDSEETE